MTPIENIKKYVRAANYLAVAQLYLQDNFLLERPLSPDDIKPRLLGHWGTCPGINFVYANLNYLIKKHNASMLFLLGPGHGFPALQANLFLEGTLKNYYPEATHDEKGIGYIAKNFSWPYGFPSHSNPGAPGVIVEGGELGYSLSTAYGAILDNPDLIAACLVGDGEAETGPTATAWHLNKFIDPATNGAVLPILHVNGYKISGPTIFGRMSNKELKALFTGYGYYPIIVEGKDPYEKMMRALEEAYQLIRSIQQRARGGEVIVAPHFPMIILKTLKGWTGIKKLGNDKIEGNCLAHQVVATEAKTDRAQLKAVEKWMRSYAFHELFDKQNGFSDEIKELVPEGEMRMGECKHAFPDRVRKDLVLPDVRVFCEDASVPGTLGSSSMRATGMYLKKLFELNSESGNFRLMSPDETYSNKLDDVFGATARPFVWPTEAWDKDIARDGRVMEMLSEHSLMGLTQGYILTGRHAIFSSYEAFVQVIASMADQYAKFLRVARETPWRGSVSSMNFILTSSGWRQEHNGFSHQNPGFIGNMLEKHGCFINVYFPPDANSTLAVMDKCLRSKNEINIIVAGKTVEPRWLTIEKAKTELVRGLMVWDFASDENPDIVFSAAGDYITKETLAAVAIVKREAPEVKVRFVNILELTALGIGDKECRLPLHDFDDYFTADKPVIFNFHGYPEALKQALFGKENPARFFVHGYIEHGSTTTTFDMQVWNKTSRWHLVMEAMGILAGRGVVAREKADTVIQKYEQKLKDHIEYIKKYGTDMDEIKNWEWKRNM